MSDLTIGAVMKVLGGEYIGGILGGIGRVAGERDARVLVFRGTPADVAAAPFAREVRGWIAVHSPVGLAALARLGLPVVTVPYHDPEVGCPSVVADNDQGIREAVRHLIAHGHRRIAFIGWLGHPAIAERCQAYRDVLAESGLPCPPELIVGVEDGSIASGRWGAEQLLDGGALPCTAVVAATDRNAAGIMQALQAAGLRVPVDVAVVGFDDMAFAQLANPPLTTLRTRFDELGRQAANLLLDEISGVAIPHTVHRVPVTLIRRRSCGCDMAADLAPPDAAALARFENGALAAQLVRMALFPMPFEPAQVPGDIWPGVDTLIGGIDAVLAGESEPAPAALSQAWQQAMRLTPDLDVLRAISTLLSRAAAQRLAATPPDPGRAQRLAAFLARSELELWRARVAYHYEGMAHLEELAQNAPTVAMVVLSGKMGQAQQLDWLRLTPAQWGCLALYDDATRAPTSTLTVAGTYRRSGPPVPDRGTRFVASALPPAEWYPAPGSAVDKGVLMLIPIVSESRDWGVLALRSPIDAHGGYTPQRPNNTAMWGALLAAALERDALAAELAELSDEDRKRAEQALRQSQAYLAEAERLSHTGSWAFDVLRDKYVYASEECLRIFELEAQEGLPTREAVSRLIHPEDWPRVNEAFEKSIRERVDMSSEFRITPPCGTVKHVHAVRHPVLNDAGNVVELVGTVIDITDRKRAEEERRAHLWFLESMDRINRAMQRSLDLEQVMSEVLEAVLSIFACDRAWLVYPCDPQAPTWRVAMEHTRPAFPGAFVLGLDLPGDPEVARVFEATRGAGGAVRFGPGAEQPVPEGLAERFSIQSMIAMVVPPKLGPPYLFGLHQCSGPRVWTPTEERLFQEIGRRLTDALTSVLIFRNLRESERRLEEAQRIAHVGYWDRDLDTGRITLSDEGCRIFGLQPEDRVTDLAAWHERWQTLIHPEDRARAAAAAAAALAGGPRYDVEYRVVHPDGEVRFVYSQGDVIRDASGRPCRMFGIMQDITERKRAEDTLRQSEAYLAEAQRLSHTGSWAFDVASNEYVYVSEEFSRIFGFAPGTLWTVEDTFQRIHPEDREKVKQNLERVVCEKADALDEYRIVLPDGTLKQIHVIQHPVLNNAGDVVTIVGTIMDITERKRAGEQRERLRQLEAELAHINRVSLLGELAASIAHEVGQPLSGVVSNGGACLRWLERDVPNVEEAREAARRIVRDGKRSGEIIARIRAMTKKAATATEKLALNETIRDVLALFGDEAKRKSVIIRPQFADDLAPVAGDRVQVQQVVLNLVMNGIEAMSSVEGRARDLVITTRNLDPDQVQVTVEDAGIGLEPDARDKLFDPFYTTKPSGMGMGLSISRSILEAHGGRLWATPKDGPGAVFHFTLPRYREESNAGVAEV